MLREPHPFLSPGRRWIPGLVTALLVLSSFPLAAQEAPPPELPPLSLAERETLIQDLYALFQSYTVGSGKELSIHVDGFEHLSGEQLETETLSNLVTLDAGWQVDTSLSSFVDPIEGRVTVLDPTWEETTLNTGLKSLESRAFSSVLAEAETYDPSVRNIVAATRFWVTVEMDSMVVSYSAAGFWRGSSNDAVETIMIADAVLTKVSSAPYFTTPAGKNPTLLPDFLSHPLSRSLPASSPAKATGQTCIAENLEPVRKGDEGPLTSEIDHLTGQHSLDFLLEQQCSCSSSCQTTCTAAVKKFDCDEQGLTNFFHAEFEFMDDETLPGPDGRPVCAVAARCSIKSCLFPLCGLNLGIGFEFEGTSLNATFEDAQDLVTDWKFSLGAACGACTHLYAVGASVSNLHQASGPVVLKLQAEEGLTDGDPIEELLTLSAQGGNNFTNRIREGALYGVTLESPLCGCSLSGSAAAGAATEDLNFTVDCSTPPTACQDEHEVYFTVRTSVVDNRDPGDAQITVNLDATNPNTGIGFSESLTVPFADRQEPPYRFLRRAPEGWEYEITTSSNHPDIGCFVLGSGNEVTGPINVPIQCTLGPEGWTTFAPEPPWHDWYDSATPICIGRWVTDTVVIGYEFECGQNCTGNGIIEREVPINVVTYECFGLNDPFFTSGSDPLKSDNPDFESNVGPIVHLRNAFGPEYPWGGLMRLRGVARHDDRGVSTIEVLVDGVPMPLAGFRRDRPDALTCTEIPSPNCDANVRFGGWWDTTQVSDGPHEVVVRATDGLGRVTNYSQSTIYVDNSSGTHPAAPAWMNATDGSNSTKVNLRWQTVPGANGYYLWRNTVDNPAGSEYLGFEADTNTFSDTTAIPGQTYFYWATSRLDGRIVSGFSPSDSGFVQGGPGLPAAPGGVAASDGAFSDRVRITWSPVADATSYSVWRHHTNTSASAATVATAVVGTSFDDTSAPVDQTFYYWVRANNALGVSGFSAPDTGFAGTSTGPVPDEPTGVSASDGTHPDRVVITWHAVSDATSYELWRHEASNIGSPELQLAGLTGTTATDTAVQPGQSYVYWVKARNANGASEFSLPDTGFAEQGSTLSAPTGVVASDGTASDRVQVSWSSVSGATHYEVFRHGSNAPASATLLQGGITGLTFADLSATPGQTFFYWVKARNATDVSGFSASDTGFAQALNLPDPPATVQAADGASFDRIQVNWTQVSGATHYELYRHTSDTPASATRLVSFLTGGSYADTAVVPGQVYYYWLTSVNDDGTSDFSASDSGFAKLPPPPAPNGVSASDGSFPNRVEVSWLPVATAETYELWRGTTNNSGSATQLAASLRGTLYLDTTVVPGQTYFYWTKTTNSHGTSGFSTPDSGYAEPTPPPGAPTGLAASDGAFEDRVRLTWTVSAGAARYEVWRHTANNASAATRIHASVSSTTFDDTLVTPGQTYHYWTKAASDAGVSGFSTPDTGHAQATAPPPAPTGVTASDGTFSDRVRVSWNAVSGVGFYSIWRSTSNNSSTATEVRSSSVSTTWDDTTVTAGVTYYYWVRSQDGSTPSAFSASDAGSAQLSNNPPPTPTGVSASDGDFADRIQVTWQASAGAESYEIWRFLGANNAVHATRLAQGVAGTAYTDTSVQPGELYFYWVKAVNAHGVSALSASNDGFAAPTAAPPAAPTGLYASDGVDPNAVILSWNASAGAQTYEVWRDTDANVTGAVRLVTGLVNPSHSDSTATAGITYYYWVKAVNSHGASPFSNSDSGSTGQIGPF